MPAQCTWMLSLDISGEREPMVSTAQVAQYEQREAAVQTIPRLFFSAHTGEPVFRSFEDLGGLDVVPVRVEVRSALHGVARTAALTEQDEHESAGGKTKHCLQCNGCPVWKLRASRK